MKKTLWQIYLTFSKMGLELLGGGYVIVPVLKREIIENKNWITEKELTEFYALSQTLPGIIAVNVSVFTGYKLKGKLGAFMALLGIITFPLIIICLLASILSLITSLDIIKSIFFGVGVAVIILIYLSIKEMWKFSVFDVATSIIFVTSFVVSFFFNVSPVFIVLGSILLSISYKILERRFKK
ncbi:MAG: chromate transporter [Cyanobacteria bacterium SIG30]|nr:chromate transporter [Cyanobacteria bacterium SIG30]